MKNGGLQPLPKDERDFALGAFYSLPPLSELPPDFSLGVFKIKNQGDSDFCTAYATCGMSELQEGVALNPHWTFAQTKHLEGDTSTWGADLRTAMKSHQKFGAVEEKVPTPNDPRKISNWPLLTSEAAKHKKQTYLSVSGPYNDFDNIRASVWKFRSEKRAVALGVVFSWPMTQRVMDNPSENGFGHAMYCVGWKTFNGVPYLEVVNSYGDTVGENGRHYFSAEVINKYVKHYGAFMFVDMPPQEYSDLVNAHMKR